MKKLFLALAILLLPLSASAVTVGWTYNSTTNNVTPYPNSNTTASTTVLSATTFCLTGDTCRTTWPSSSSASTTLLSDNNTFTGDNTFSSILYSNGSPLIDNTNTLFYSNGYALFDGITYTLLLPDGSTFGDSSGNVYILHGLYDSSNSLGSNGQVLTNNGGTSVLWETPSSGFATTSANYWIGTYDKGFFFSTTSANYWKSQTSFTAASSTLLSDNNAFSGVDIFSKLLNLSATTSKLLATDANGNVIATTSIGVNLLNNQGAANGTVLMLSGGVPTWAATSSGTTYTAGTGLNLTGTAFSLKSYISTSSADTANQIPYWTTTNGNPARLSGGSAGLTWASGTSLLTATNASTTNLTAGTWAGFGSSAQSSFNSTGVLTLGTALGLASGGTNASLTGASGIVAMNSGNTALSIPSTSYTLSSTLATLPNASTTNVTVGTSLQIPSAANPEPTLKAYCSQSTNSPYQIQCGNNAGATSVYDDRIGNSFGMSSTTAFVGTTTVAIENVLTGYTATSISCTLQPGGATGEIEWYYANPTAYTSVTPFYFPASTTPGIYTIASNNTPATQATTTLLVGNTTGSPTSVNCGVYGPITGI